MTIHGDDFIVCASRQDIDWLVKKLKEKVEIKHEVLGWNFDEVQQSRILNRVVTLRQDGFTYEPDPRHGELIVRDMFDQVGKVKKNLHQTRGSTGYRAIAARANYLAIDRADIGAATKMAAERMSNPQEDDWERLARIASIIRSRPGVIQVCKLNEADEQIHVYTDSHWATHTGDGKSTY